MRVRSSLDKYERTRNARLKIAARFGSAFDRLTALLDKNWEDLEKQDIQIVENLKDQLLFLADKYRKM